MASAPGIAPWPQGAVANWVVGMAAPAITGWKEQSTILPISTLCRDNAPEHRCLAGLLGLPTQHSRGTRARFGPKRS